jgi:hypothetical protein
METFLARVVTIKPTTTDFETRVTGNVSTYDNKDFTEDEVGRGYGAITYAYQNAIVDEDIALPFDKNNFTFPIKGETVIILKIEGETFYLPFSNVPIIEKRHL